MGEIARRNGVTRQAVGYRVKQEGWKVAPDVQEERRGVQVKRWLDRVYQTTLGKASDPREGEDWDPSAPALLWARDFHARPVAHVLAAIAEGEGEKVAIALSGIEKNKWNAWQKVDREFQALVMAARAAAARKLRGHIAAAAEADWKAAAYLLEKTEETAEFVHQPDQQAGQGGIVVKLSIARDEQVALSLGVKEAAPLIDVTPQQTEEPAVKRASATPEKDQPAGG